MTKIIKGTVPGRRQLKYPFRDMEVGDAFDAPYTNWNSVQSNARAFGRGYVPVRTFTTRKIDSDTVRIWRVS